METLLLSNEDVAKVIDLDEIFNNVKAGYISMYKGNVVLPDIMNLVEPGTHKGFDFKAALDTNAGYFCMKASSGGYPDNEKLGMLPGFNTVYLYEAATSACCCIMEGNYIRNLRTAAGAAVANDLFSRKNASSYFAFGIGRIGKASLRATMRIRDIKDVYCYGFFPGETDAFIAEMSKEFPNVNYHPVETLKEGAENADIIVCVTLARSGKLIKKEWLKPGTHITEIGVDSEGKQELDVSCFDGTKIFNDSIKMASMYGDTHNAIAAGVITKDDIYAEIGEIAAGAKVGRENDEEITVYDTVGLGVQDLAMAKAIYEHAVKLGIGTKFTFI